MAPLSFDSVFNRVIGIEGGYSNDPKDPGGETNWGISKRAYPDLDIRALTRDDAKAIYLRDFWNPIEADTLPGAVAFQLFDFAVHSGMGTAIRYLQRALGVADDGHYGPVSRAAAAKIAAADLVMRLLAERLDFLTRAAGWDHDGRGWARRIAADLRFGAADA